jgi:hypothetical protein
MKTPLLVLLALFALPFAAPNAKADGDYFYAARTMFLQSKTYPAYSDFFHFKWTRCAMTNFRTSPNGVNISEFPQPVLIDGQKAVYVTDSANTSDLIAQNLPGFLAHTKMTFVGQKIVRVVSRETEEYDTGTSALLHIVQEFRTSGTKLIVSNTVTDGSPETTYSVCE